MNYLALLIGSYLAFADPRQPIHVGLEEWQAYKTQFGKVYENATVEGMRRAIFGQRKMLLNTFDDEISHNGSFSVGLNHLAELSDLEISLMNGFKLPAAGLNRNDEEGERYLAEILARDVPVPDEVDWRQVPGRVSAVKNQGQCGSCWAFATTGVLEGQQKDHLAPNISVPRSASPIELSEQNLVDCVKADGGCEGGIMSDALDAIKAEGGIDAESAYPYEARTRQCRFKRENVVMTDSGSVILPTGDEQKLKEVVAKFGPVAVAIDASSIWFQLYRHGVYVNRRCKNKEDQLDHGVLVVGYGTDKKGGDYWIVKNSWGPSYGEKGYIRMARNRKNMCGIATAATIPKF